MTSCLRVAKGFIQPAQKDITVNVMSKTESRDVYWGFETTATGYGNLNFCHWYHLLSSLGAWSLINIRASTALSALVWHWSQTAIPSSSKWVAGLTQQLSHNFVMVMAFSFYKRLGQ